MVGKVLVGVMLICAQAHAAPRIDCPPSCVVPAAFDSQLDLVVTCAQKTITLRLDDGREHVIERVVPNTPASCRAVPELVQILVSSNSVTRAASTRITPAPSAKSAPRPTSQPEPADEPQPIHQPQPVSQPPIVEAEPLIEEPVELDAGVPASLEPIDAGLVARPSALTVDLGAGAATAPTVALGTARVAWWPWSRIGFFVEGGITSTENIVLPTGSAATERQFAGLGATLSLRPVASWGPRLSLFLGGERVAGRGEGLSINRSDAAVGVFGSLAVEWHQPLFMGFYARAAVSGLARPASWSVQVNAERALAWPLFGVQGSLSLGWLFSFGVFDPLPTLEPEKPL